MSVRKRSWKTESGESREAWVVDYTDQLKHRHLKTFTRKKDAEAYHAQIAVSNTGRQRPVRLPMMARISSGVGISVPAASCRLCRF